jgi:hypothetical protein
MEGLIAAVILEEEEDDNLLVYCVSDGATDILSKGKDGGYYYRLMGRYLMDSGMTLREFFQIFERHFLVC